MTNHVWSPLVPSERLAEMYAEVHADVGDGGVAVLWGVLVMGVLAYIVTRYGFRNKKVKRKGFSLKMKSKIDRSQKYKCISCGKFPRHKKYDHIVSRGDNSFSNGQMFCGDCHDDKTNAERKMRDNRTWNL